MGRRHCFLVSTSLSCLLGVSVCLSNSAVMFLLLRLFQGSVLAGVYVSSYIIRECPPPTYKHVCECWCKEASQIVGWSKKQRLAGHVTPDCRRLLMI